MLGNGIVGIQREVCNKWERRAPLTPSHCAQLLHAARKNGVKKIILQPCTKRIYDDAQYQKVGCQISEDLSECGLILGIKQPTPGGLLPDRAYAFFSHTHKAQPKNMPLLDEVIRKRVSLYDYELIVGERGERKVAFGEYAGRAGMIDILRGLGERFLCLGYSTPFLSLGSSYMYTSLSAAKAAVLAVGDEIRTSGLPLAISPLTFVFTGTGNVSRGAQEIFQLLPHFFVHPSKLPQLRELSAQAHMENSFIGSSCKGGNFQVYGCVVSSENIVAPNDLVKIFDKVDYYNHPEQYHSVFHNNIAPYASVIVNCMYWETRYPRLLTNEQLQKMIYTDSANANPVSNRLIGVADITCDLGGSIECVTRTTSIEKPFFRYNPTSGSYHDDMDGEGVIVLAVDNLPTELPKEATNHFGEVLVPFLHSMAYGSNLEDLLMPVRRACITHKGQLNSLYEYIPRMQQSEINETSSIDQEDGKIAKQVTTMVSLTGHLFDQFLINEALDVIEGAGGCFRLNTCKLGQTADATSYAELEVMADSEEALSHIVDLLAAIASHSNLIGNNLGEKKTPLIKPSSRISVSSTGRRPTNYSYFQVSENSGQLSSLQVLVLGAGRMCEPAVKYLALNSIDLDQSSSGNVPLNALEAEGNKQIWVTVASLFLEDAQKVIEGVPYTTAAQLDVGNNIQLQSYVSKASLVISLLPPSCHVTIAKACIEMGRHLVTASYVSEEMAALHERAKSAGVTLLCEMGLDPGIDHMMAMKMIKEAHFKGGRVQSFVSYCGGLPSPNAANNPLGYKFSWNPAGALKAGRNSAVYKYNGELIRVTGEELFGTAAPVRIPNLPAFALERLPNRDSLKYGDLYGITEEASTIFRATLRYEGFSDIMNSLANLGFFSMEANPFIQNRSSVASERPSYRMLLNNLLVNLPKENRNEIVNLRLEDNFEDCDATNITLAEKLVILGCCKDINVAKRTSSCIRNLELDNEEIIPESCECTFDVLCSRMEKKLNFAPNEQDMVILHHQLEVTYEDLPAQKFSATLLEIGDNVHHGDIQMQKPQSAMARTVGLPVAIGAQLLLLDKIKSRGVLRPLDPEIYLPALQILEASGLQIEEHVEYL